MKTRQWTACLRLHFHGSRRRRHGLRSAAAPAPAAGTSVKAVVDAGKTYAPISPHIYGMFIEHAGSLVYSGLWAEMVGDRKFYYPIAAEDAAMTPDVPERGPGGGRGDVRRWVRIGPAASIAMDAEHAYTGDHSPAIALSHGAPRHSPGRTGPHAGQRVRGPHRSFGRSVGQGDGEPRLGQRRGRSTIRHDRQTHGGIRRVPPAHKSPVEGDAQLEITAVGSGTVRIGAVSLMPADNVQGWSARSSAC